MQDHRPRGLFFHSLRGTGLSGFSKAKRELDAEILKIQAKEAGESGAFVKPLPRWTIHDFRRAGVSGLVALGHDETAVDRVLNHVPRKLNGVAGIYNRHTYADQKRAALVAWADHIVKVVNG